MFIYALAGSRLRARVALICSTGNNLSGFLVECWAIAQLCGLN